MENTGQILRSRKTGKSKYTPITNEILQSETLTPEEKSILVHLLSLPENWVVYKCEIWRKMNMGRERFNKNWKGLVEKGYIVSIRLIDRDTNLIKGWNHIVYEEPVLSENRIDQSSESPEFGKSEDWGVNKEINIESNNKTKEEVTKEFETIWELYGKIGNKKTSQTTFNRLSKKDKEAIANHIPLYIKNHKDNDKQDFIPHFTTYLNQRRWEDALPYKTKEVISAPKVHYATLTLDD